MELVQITGWIDQGLNEKAYIIPGLGDFGERRWFMFPFYHYIFLTIEQGIVNNQPMAFVKIITLPVQTLHGSFFFFFYSLGYAWHKDLQNSHCFLCTKNLCITKIEFNLRN